MGEIVDFRPTRRSIYRAAVKEMERMYRLSGGGADPLVDDESRMMFELGEIEEVPWVTWEKYCTRVLNMIGEQE